MPDGQKSFTLYGMTPYGQEESGLPVGRQVARRALISEGSMSGQERAEQPGGQLEAKRAPGIQEGIEWPERATSDQEGTSIQNGTQ